MKIALIPSYNPTSILITLAKELSQDNYEVIVVNDGSNTNLDHIFKSCSKYAKVISYSQNQGKGYALKQGLNYIQNNYSKPYYVVTMDSDGQHLIKDANHLINQSIKYPDSLILGKRIRDKNIPLRSTIGNNITRFVYHQITKIDIYDTQTGLRAFSNKLIDKLSQIEGNRYEYEINVLLTMAKEKVNIQEVEIETIYIDENKSSHFNPIKDSYRIYKSIFKFYFQNHKSEKK